MTIRSPKGLIEKAFAAITACLALVTLLLHTQSTTFDQYFKQLPFQQSWDQNYAAGNSLYRAGKYKEAYELWGKSLQQAESENVTANCSGDAKIEVLKKLALMYKTQQKVASARNMYEQAIPIAVQIYGRKSQSVSALMLDLGRTYLYSSGANDLSKGDELLSNAFLINEKLYGRYTIPTGDIAIALGQLKEQEKEYDQAAEYFALAVEIGNRLEPNIISCCRIGPRQGLARCYEALGRYEDALKVHHELVTMAQTGAKNMLPTIQGNLDACMKKMAATK